MKPLKLEVETRVRARMGVCLYARAQQHPNQIEMVGGLGYSPSWVSRSG